MTYNNENAMMETKKDFILPAMVEDDCISVDVSEDYEGLRLSFPRVKIPGGGSLQFEIPSDDPENPDYTKYIEGVILYNHDTCAYWPEGSEYDDNVTPLCSSVDGKTGYGAPGGVCATCALNQYGSVEKGKGKACKNMRNLYILRSGEHMPMLLSLPPTSLRPYSDFITAAFATRRRPIYSGVVQIGLKRVDNGSNTYSVATFRLVQRFEGNDLLQIKQYADGFREQIKAMNQQRAMEAELGNNEPICDAVDSSYHSTDDGEHFCKRLNQELENKGYITVSGKVSKKYFADRFYGGAELMKPQPYVLNERRVA